MIDCNLAIIFLNVYTFQKWALNNARQNSPENRIQDVFQRGMDRSDPEVLENYMEATIMDRRKKSCEFPKELLDLCDEEDLVAYDAMIDEEDDEDQDTKDRRSLLERLFAKKRRSPYNLRKSRLTAPNPGGDDVDGLLDAEDLVLGAEEEVHMEQE